MAPVDSLLYTILAIRIDMEELFTFLRNLAANNNREWFNAHKDEYLRVKATAERLATELIAAVATIDERAAMLRVQDCTYRIYRDTRFSPDKTPYKTHIGIFVNPPKGKKGLTCGYYLHLEPDHSFICGGTICLPGPVLKALRRDIYDNIDEYVGIVESPEFKALFPTVGANPVKTAPQGFDRTWPYLEYVKPRDFVVEHGLTDAEVCAPNLVERLHPYLIQIGRFLQFVNYTIEPFDTGAERK